MFSPDLLELFGFIIAGAGSAFIGGKNSLNGFKVEVRSRFDAVDHRFDSVDHRLDKVVKTDGQLEHRLKQLETK